MIQDIIELSQKEIKFGQVIAGNIFEESLEIFNKFAESLVVKIVVLCTN